MTLMMWAIKNPENLEQNCMSSRPVLRDLKTYHLINWMLYFDDFTQQIKQKLNAEPSDMIRLSINHPSLDMGIHIPFMCAEQLEGTV